MFTLDQLPRQFRSIVTSLAALALLITAIFSPTSARADGPQAPPQQAGCDTISTEAALVSCITFANSNPDATDLTLTGNITLTAPLPTITTPITIFGNTYVVSGGGTVHIVDVSATGTLTLTDIEISNSFSLTAGGAISNLGTVHLSNGTLSSNDSGGVGGAIDNQGTLTITNAILANNQSAAGGAINNTGSLTITNSRLIANYGTNGAGAIYNLGTATITASTIDDNASGGSGGAINNTSSLTIINSTFASNTSNNGGGIYSTGTLTLTSSTFYQENGNVAGAALYVDGTTHLAGNLIGTPLGGNNCFFGGSATVNNNGYNFSADGSCGFGGGYDNANLPLAPFGVGLYEPQYGNDAIGAIPFGTTVNNNGATLACDGTMSDQQGITRPILPNSACTSGSVEVPDGGLPGLTITELESPMETNEDGDTAQFTIVLNTPPTDTVNISVTSDVPTEGLITGGASLTFDGSNWDTPQTVTATGQDDAVPDGNNTFQAIWTTTSADGNYNGIVDSLVIVNIDNDPLLPNLIIFEYESPMLTDEDGDTAQFGVVPSTMPAATVTVTVVSDTPTEGQVTSGATLIFDAGNWDVEQLVTVTGQDDAVVDGTVAYNALWTSASTDPDYDGLSGSVNVYNIDNEAPTPGVSVVELETPMQTDEDGDTAQFTLVLDTPPSATVSITTISDTTTEGQVTSGASLTFDGGNWDTPQTVTITGQDDAVVDGDVAYQAIWMVVSTDANYDGLAGSINLTNLDNDVAVAGITITELETPMQTDEDGDTAQFSVVLDSAPTATVTVTTASDTPAEGQVTSGASLTFDAGNWDTPQTVTVTGQDDAIVDGDVAYQADWSATSADANYDGLAGSVNLTNLDNDTSAAGVTITELETPMQTDEAGDTAQFTVVLDSAPTATVTITTVSDNTAEGQITSGASLTFDAGNWDTPQTVTVTGQDDAVHDGDIAYQAIWMAVSADTDYDGRAGSVNLTNLDDDPIPAGVTVTELETPMQTDENGDTAQFSVVLDSAPTATVTITTASDNPAEGQVTSGASLTFDAGNWDTPQTVTVTGQDDAVVDGPVAYQADWSATSADAGYNGLAGSVNITNLDNEPAPAGITITQLETPMQTDEAGDTAQFSVVLNSAPSASVTVTTSSDDPSEGQVTGGASLTFDGGNWDTPQTVTVTGQDDSDADGDMAYQADWSAASVDANYNGLAGSVNITNLDDDTVPAITFDIPELVTWEENEDNFSYGLALGSEPAAAPTVVMFRLNAIPAAGEVVTITITAPASQLRVTPTALVFDETNWTIPQTVTVDPVDDGVTEGEQTVYILHTASSSLGSSSPYDGLTAVLQVKLYDTQAEAFPPPFHTPNIGEIMISVGQTQPAYDSAGGQPIYLPSGAPLLLPYDFDGNGFDTYTVTESQTVAGEAWYGIFIGNATWVWVPADGVTVLR